MLKFTDWTVDLVGRCKSQLPEARKAFSMVGFLGLLGLILFYLFFYAHLPLSIYTLNGYDDALFIKNAISIASGDWLGPYGNLALAKGSGFPIFLALSSFTGLPITFLLALLQIAATGLLLHELKRIIPNKIILVVLGLIILFHPALMPMRVMRDYIYPAFTLFLFAGLIRASLYNASADSIWPIIGYGFLGGWFFLIREEGVWIAPIILIIFMYRYVMLRPLGQLYHPVIKGTFVFLCGLAIPSFILSSVNYTLYGRFITQDFTNGYYVKALGQLHSIKDESQIPYVLVSERVRSEVYKVSPAFRELKPLLEGELKFWQDSGCAIYPSTCGDYAGGWFMWAFRDAVARRGYYESAEKAENFYQQMSIEIKKACDERLLVCRSELLPLVPEIPRQNYSMVMPKLFEAYQYLLGLKSPDLTAGPSAEPAFLLEKYRAHLGYPKIVPSDSSSDRLIKGWFYGASAVNQGAWIELICSDGVRNIRFPVPRESSPDLVKYFKDTQAAMQRFTIQIPHAYKCSLVSTDTRTILPENLILNKSRAYSVASNTLYIDQKVVIDSGIESQKPLVIKRKIISIYQWLMMPILFAGLVCFFVASLIALVIKKTWPSFIYIVSLAIWAAIILRMVILMIIDLTSFPGISVLYMLPIYPMLILTSFLSIWIVVSRDYVCHPAYRNGQ